MSRVPEPFPAEEEKRLAALHASELLDTPAEEAFDRLTRLACSVLDAPIALVVLLDADRQFVKSTCGVPEAVASARQTPLSHSFCRHTVARAEPLAIADTLADPLVRDNPSIARWGIRTYLGVPLTLGNGATIGTLCVMGYEARVWTPGEVDVLRELGTAAVNEIALRMLLRQSEREQTERLSAERVTALEQLALGLRHEINNALAGLLLETEILAEQPDLPERVRRGLGIVETQAQRIHGVLRRLENAEALHTRPYGSSDTMIDLSPHREEP